MRGSEEREWRWEGARLSDRRPGPGSLRGARSAAALPRPGQPRTLAARTPTEASPGSNSVNKLADTPAGVLLRVPHKEPRPHKHPDHGSLSVPDAQTSRSRCSPAPSAHLIQAVDFLRGIHHFSAAGALRVHCRGSRGRRLSGDGWGLRGAAVTSPARPAPPRGRRKGGGRRDLEWARAKGKRARLAGRRRGRGWARGGAWRLGAAALSAPARLRLGLRAARSASLAPQVPVTHTHSRPPLLSLAPPPRSLPPPRRPNPPARPEPSGRERARRAPTREGEAGEGRAQHRGAPQAPRPAATARPGSAPGAAAGGGQVGGAGRGAAGDGEMRGVGVGGGGIGLEPARSVSIFSAPARSPPPPSPG